MNTDPAIAPKIEIARKLHAEVLDAQRVCRAADFFRLAPEHQRKIRAKRDRLESKMLRFLNENALPISLFF